MNNGSDNSVCFRAISIGIVLVGLMSGLGGIAYADNPPELTSIVITPENPPLHVGESVVFTAEGKNQYGEPFTFDPLWEGDGTYGTITPHTTNPPTCTYTATKPGSGYIICWESPGIPGQRVFGSTDITVLPGGSQVLTSIVVEPETITLELNDSQLYTATGYDQNNQPMDPPIDPTWRTTGGTITTGSGGLYTATQKGDFTVIASVSNSVVTGSARVHVGNDADVDNCRDATEDGAPNAGDGNGDGVPDRQQPDVSSIPSETSQGYLTITTSCEAIHNLNVYLESPKLHDRNYDYPYGLVGFNAPCESATIRTYFHGASDPNGLTYRQYGPVYFGDIPMTQWYPLGGVEYGTTVIDGESVAYIEFRVLDGGLGDDTVLDGQIVIGRGGLARIAADFNADLAIDFADVLFLAEQWLSSLDGPADLDGSGQVDNTDFALLSQNWCDHY